MITSFLLIFLVLSSTFLRLRISSALRVDKELSKAADALAQNTVYTYPTIDALTGFIAGIISNLER
jgi:hypothetical protein